MCPPPSTVPKAELEAFCIRHNVRKLSLFGSVLRGDFGPDNDVDVLVDFEPGHVPGFLRLHELEQELSRLFGGRRIDLVTPRFLNERMRDRVLAEAQPAYDRG